MSALDRLRSSYHGFWLRLSERFGRVRRARAEIPAGRLEPPSLEVRLRGRVAALAERYGCRFEDHLARHTALENYARLDLIDQAYRSFGIPVPQGGTVHDVGCASFWYAASLGAAFRPRRLVGVEIEGFRRLRGGANRAEQALGYVANVPNTEFRIADYRGLREPADLVTAFFPFVTPEPVLAWRLPLRLLTPQALLSAIRGNLGPDGEFLMVNHGDEEAARAAALAAAAGFACLATFRCDAPLLPRTSPAVVSRWRHGPGRRRGRGSGPASARDSRP